MAKLISVIVPLYNEEEVIHESYRRLTNVLATMEDFFSKVLMDWLTADWEINSCLLASEKLKEVAT